MPEDKQVDAKTARQEIFNVKFDVDLACHVVQALTSFYNILKPSLQSSRLFTLLESEVDHLFDLRARQRRLEASRSGSDGQAPSQQAGGGEKS